VHSVKQTYLGVTKKICSATQNKKKLCTLNGDWGKFTPSPVSLEGLIL